MMKETKLVFLEESPPITELSDNERRKYTN